MQKLLVALVLPLLLTAARGDEPPAPAQARVKLVGTMLNSGQALVWDEDRGEYRLLRAGDSLGTARIISIEGEQMVIEHQGARETLDLQPPPSQKAVRKAKRMPALIVSATPDPAAATAAVSDSAAALAAASAPPAPAPVAGTAPVAGAAPIAATPLAPTAPMTATAPAATTAAPAASSAPLPPTAPVIATAPVAAPAPAIPLAPNAPLNATAPVAATAPAIPLAPNAPGVATAPVAATAPAAPATPPAPNAPVIATAPVAATAPAAPAIPLAPNAPGVATAPVAATAPAAPATPPAPNAPVIATAPVAATAPTAPVAPVAAASPPTMLIPRDVLSRELADFDSLGNQVSLAQEAGGFRLQSLRAGSFLARAGLRDGDLLTRVDGRPLASIDDCAAAYAGLRVATRFTVDVQRDGRNVQLRYVVGAPQAAQR